MRFPRFVPVLCSFVTAAAAAAALIVAAAPPAHAQAPAPYKGAIVLNADDGQVLFETNADVASPPASVTKLMTFLVVQDQIKAGRLTLQTPVTVNAEDSRMGGTQVWLKEGEVFTVEELLFAIMIQSANDAAHALARAAAGSRAAFVQLMNERAQQLGMKHTTWRTPHGLPASSRRLEESDLTTPRDLATLSLALLRETDVLRYSAVARAPFGEGKRPEPVMMDNHNNLLGRVPGVDGLKTGFTRQAGFCLAATAERDGHRLVAVIMGSPTSKERDLQMADLLDHHFAQLPRTTGTVRLPASPASPAAPPTSTPPAPRVAPAPEKPADSNEPPTVRFTLPQR